MGEKSISIHQMKKTFIITLALALITFNSCKNEEETFVPKIDVVAQKRDVRTYEIVNIIARENLAGRYSATFGSVAVELLKTSDSTLTFFVPDVAPGEAQLRFDLATIDFNVTKTQEINSDQLITNFNKQFDAQLSLLDSSTDEEAAEVDDINEYKDEVIALFNSLSDDEKRQAALFYEANKDVFKSFANTTFTNLDASSSMRFQSDCPRTDFKTFYGCTAENLGNAAIGLKDASKEFLKMLALAGASAYLAPASFGLSAFGTTLALGTAGYLLITEVKPAAAHFRKSLTTFLKANWIFSKALFESTTEVFQDQISTSLNLKPKFRSITSNDSDVSAESGFFINAMSSLNEYWNKLAAVFGNAPVYRNTEEATTLDTKDVHVLSISNANVEYSGITGQALTFRSLSGKEEDFDFRVRVSKEGFVEEKTLKGRVIASDPCEDGSMTAPVITNVTLECNAYNEIAILISFTANGTGAIIDGDGGSCEPEKKCYPTRLYFRNPGAAEFAIAANGYNVSLRSGNFNEGVAELRLTWSGYCVEGKTAAQALAAHYPGYEWKVELMNKCNQRSAQWSF